MSSPSSIFSSTRLVRLARCNWSRLRCVSFSFLYKNSFWWVFNVVCFVPFISSNYEIARNIDRVNSGNMRNRPVDTELEKHHVSSITWKIKMLWRLPETFHFTECRERNVEFGWLETDWSPQAQLFDIGLDNVLRDLVQVITKDFDSRQVGKIWEAIRINICQSQV